MNKKVFTLSAVMAGLLFGAAAHAADTRIGVTIYKYERRRTRSRYPYRRDDL